jgi:hypothetical protein
MSHEVQGLAIVPHRAWVGWAALAAGALMLGVWFAPPLVRPVLSVPEGLPTGEQVERICLEAVRWSRRGGRELTGSCARPGLEPGTREALLSFVARLPPHRPALATVARLDDQVEARLLAQQYEELLLQLQARDNPGAHRALRLERSIRSALSPLSGLLVAVLLLMWALTGPLRVVVSVGRIRLGPYLVSIEEVDSWSFTGPPTVTRTDGSHVALGGRQLAPEDRVALDEAMKVAMGRVKDAAPIDAKALRAVQKLTQ